MNSHINLYIAPDLFYSQFETEVINMDIRKKTSNESLAKTHLYVADVIKTNAGSTFTYNHDEELTDFIYGGITIKVPNKIKDFLKTETLFSTTVKPSLVGVEAQLFTEFGHYCVASMKDFYSMVLKGWRPDTELGEKQQAELKKIFDEQFGENPEFEKSSFMYISDQVKNSTTLSAVIKQAFNAKIVKRVNGCIVENPGLVPIWIFDLMNYSNKKVIDQKNYESLIKMLADKDNQKLALIIMNNCNITLSIINLLLLLNRTYMIKDIKKSLKNIQTLIPVYSSRTADDIVSTAEGVLGRVLHKDELMYIASNYFNPNTESSALFKFNLKLK